MMLLFLSIFIIIIYYLAQNQNPCNCIAHGEENHLNCRTCGMEIEIDYNYCPSCKTQIKKACIKCGKMIDVSWRRCPYCD